MRNQERFMFIVGLAIVAIALGVAGAYQVVTTDGSGGSFSMFWEQEATPEPRDPGSVILPPTPWEPEPPAVEPPVVEPPVVPPEPPSQEWKPLQGDPVEVSSATRAQLKELAELEGMQDFSQSTYTPREQYSRDYLLCCDAMEVPESEAPREIEEADLVKLEDDILYILNPYRGFVIVDLSDPDDPQVLGTCQVLGNPVEMYVVGTRAYVIVSCNFDYWYRWSWWGFRLWDAAPRYQIGSQLVILDVSQPTAPSVLREVPIEGFVSDSRRVGEVIYFVSNCHSWYNEFTNTQMEDLTYVMSLNIADPQAIRVEDMMDFPGESNVIHVTTRYLYVAAWSYTYDGTLKSRDGKTDITLVDISDPRGNIEYRDVFSVDGRVLNKYQMDHWGNTFRVVSHFPNRNRIGGESELRTFDVRDPFDVRPLGKLLIDDAGNLMATRFAGERAYTIHLPRAPDPLDVIDLSDPEDPRLCDVFEMPGWVTHMEVRGHKIIALGMDDSDGQRNVAVSLFDVSDPWNAVMQDRVRIGERWASSEAISEPKALTVLDDQGLVLVPFSTGDYDDDGRYYYYHGVQLVSFDLLWGNLRLGGFIEQPDAVTRTRSLHDRALSTSARFLQVSDLSDLGDPRVIATVELCPEVLDARVEDGYVLEVVQHYTETDYYLEVFPEGRPDLGRPIERVKLGKGVEGWFWQEDYLVVLTTLEVLPGRHQATVSKYCLKDPTFIWSRQATFAVGPPNEDLGYYYYRYYWWDDLDYWGWYWVEPKSMGDDDIGNLILTSDDLLYFHRNGTVHILDVSGPRSPVLVGQVGVVGGFYGLMEAGDEVLVITFEYENRYVADRYRYMYSYEVTPIRINPLLGAYLGSPYSVPGLPVGASTDGRRLFTVSHWYTGASSSGNETLNVLWIGDDRATLEAAYEITAVDKVVISGDTAVFVDKRYERVEEDDGSRTYLYSTVFQSLDLVGGGHPTEIEMEGYFDPLLVGDGHVVLKHSGEYAIYVLSDLLAEDGPALYSYQLRPEVKAMHVVGDAMVIVQGLNGYSVLDLHY